MKQSKTEREQLEDWMAGDYRIGSRIKNLLLPVAGYNTSAG